MRDDARDFSLSLPRSKSLSQAIFAQKLGSHARISATSRKAAKIAKKLGVPEKVFVQLAIQDIIKASHLNYRVELLAA